MSSAARLRHFGKGTAAVATATLVMTAFGPAAFAWDVAPQDPGGTVVAAAAAGANIGIVDTDDPLAETGAAIPSLNHGTTLVQAGETGQAIADIRLVIPNTFRQNDRIKLRLFDRSATETNAGNSNTEAATSLGFSAAPTVSVLNVPQAHDTVVDPDTEAATTPNTETDPPNPWVAPTPASAIALENVKPTTVPSLTASLEKSVGVGSDMITLNVGNAATGDPNATWVVTLTALKVDVGAGVTPGELRVVPFAFNADVADPQSEWFGGTGPLATPAGDGNLEVTATTPRQIEIFTVPAYVAPVKFSAANADIFSDGTAQSIGDLTISEVHGAALGSAGPNNVYTVTVTGATIQNTSTTGITGKVNNGGTNEGITVTGVTANTVTFRVDNPDAVKKSDFLVSGLQLSATSPGQIRFNVTGTAASNLAQFMALPGTSTAIGTIPAGATFAAGAAIGVNEGDIAAPTDELMAAGTASAGTTAIGGNNRYETARKIAKEWSPLGDEAIIASGENYPDALSSGFLSQRLGAPIILTMNGSVPADTMESLRERGVRKVYLIGGEAAISRSVSDKLLATPSYMWSDSAKNLVPRGGNLEVVRLGGNSRYSTNALVNLYAAAQNTGAAVVGKTTPTYGSAQKTTAMLARGDGFADALTANVLTSGRNTGLFTAVGSSTSTLTSTSGPTLSPADVEKLGAGVYTVAAGGMFRNGGTTPVATAASAGSTIYNLAGGGIVSFSANPVGATFTITSSGVTGYMPQIENLNALPLILTPKGELGDQAEQQLSDLHIEHTLVVGGADVIPDAVVKSVDGMNITTRRLAGNDRYETATAVNAYAWTSSVGSTTNTTPGLGFDGGKTVVNGTTYGQGEAFLANGTRFPDALVAGPWVSRRHDAMVLVLQNSNPEPTKKFLSDTAAVLDRAIGLGLGSAVSSTVITEANRLVNSR